MEHRAYSVVTIKSVDEERRVLVGMATTPKVDSYGDVVEPKGVKSSGDIPLFLYHDSWQTVGRAKLGKATADGVPFEARIPLVKEEGRLKERVDEAWQMLKYRLITGVSIGFRAIEDKVERLANGGLRFLETEVLELSLVPIPANSEATITAIKSIDTQLRAASGLEQRGAKTGERSARDKGTTPATTLKGLNVKTLQQMIEERTTKSARASELLDMRKAEGRKFSDAEASEFDTLSDEVESLDDEIRVKRFEERQVAAATRVRTGSPEEQRSSRGPTILVKTQDPDDKFEGQSFTRVLIAKAVAMTSGDSPIAVAEQRWGKSHPKFVQFLRVAVAGGGTGSGEWGAELAQMDARFTGDFVEYLYAKTVFDQLGLRSIPSRVKVKGQDGAFTGYWVGESKAIPASAGSYSDVDLSPLKVAGLAVISMELLEDSQPSAEVLVRDGLVEASSQRVDMTFLSNAAAVAGVSPAGILNGVTAFPASGVDLAAVRADLQTLLYPFVTGKMASGITLVMNPATAMALGMMYGTLDQLAFPEINENGGKLGGRPVIVGDNVTPGNIIAIRPSDVWRIGDSGIRVSMSREATIEQDTAPTGATDTPTAATANLTNMFQEESVAFKVVRRINFQKRRTNAVQVITDAEYGGVAS
jgi:HK97 family phage major capsid protein/HK97 family phage prohead protease